MRELSFVQFTSKHNLSRRVRWVEAYPFFFASRDRSDGRRFPADFSGEPMTNFLVRALSTHPGLRVAVLAPVLAFGGLATASGAKPHGCTNVPISWTFVATTTADAAIWNDIPTTAYQDGVTGVTAVIFFNNDCNGTRDAVLDLGGRSSTRTLSMKFPAPIAGSILAGQGLAPSFAGDAEGFQTKAGFNIHNILARNTPGIEPGQPATFYTKFTDPFPGPDGKSYKLVRFPFNCPVSAICAYNGYDPYSTDPFLNMPEEAAWVKVTYTPRNASGQPCTATNTTNCDSWIVDGELDQRSTLFLKGKNGSQTHSGQYSMPFKIMITALAPLPSVP